MTSKLKYLETKQPEKIENLMIFIHGYGANGKNLLTLAPAYQYEIENCHFLAPNAPFETGMYDSYYWFPINEFNEDHLQEGLDLALPILDKFIEFCKKTYKVKNSQIILFGFSQGSALAIHHALQASEAYKAVLSFSGGALSNISDKVKNQTPICLIHGLADPVLPVSTSEETAKNLKAINHPYDLKIIKELEHNIDRTGLEFSIEFLKKN